MEFSVEVFVQGAEALSEREGSNTGMNASILLGAGHAEGPGHELVDKLTEQLSSCIACLALKQE